MNLAQQSADALENTRVASAKALQDLQMEMGSLKVAQDQHTGQVKELNKEVQRVRHDSTQMSVAANLQSKTGQTSHAITVNQRLEEQKKYLDDVVQQLQKELQTRRLQDEERTAEIAQLRDAVAKE